MKKHLKNLENFLDEFTDAAEKTEDDDNLNVAYEWGYTDGRAGKVFLGHDKRSEAWKDMYAVGYMDGAGDKRFD